MVPQRYVEACYRYAIGCFWVKFTPFHEAAHSLLSEVFEVSNQMIDHHLRLVHNLSLLLHLASDDNDLL